MKIQKQPTLADSICDVRARKVKKNIFHPNKHTD